MKAIRSTVMITMLALVLSLIPAYSFAADGTVSGADSDGVKTLTSADKTREGWAWNKSKTKKYYYENGVKVTGKKKIGHHWYYFSDTGAMKTGVVKIGKRLHYFKKENGRGLAVRGWVKCDDGKIRYSYGKGKIASGKTRIDGKLYYFTTDRGTLHKKGFFKHKGNVYYCEGKGVLATGWKALTRNDKLRGYYFHKKSGRMARGETIGYLKIPKSGALHEAYALGIRELDNTSWTLFQAYKNSYLLTYYGRWWRQSTAEQYALRGFNTGGGNCYVMASTFYIQAKLLGYDVHQVEGKVNGWHPHSWTVIKQDGTEWVYDPNFRNETGRDGWKIWYGKRGTWRYSNYHKMN